MIQYQGKTILFFINGSILNLLPQSQLRFIESKLLGLIWGICCALAGKGRDNNRYSLLIQAAVMTSFKFMPMLATCILLSGGVNAQGQRPLTVNELITIALDASPQVLAARDQSKAVRGQLSTARAIPNPEFEINTGQQKSASICQ